ncbi:hypothetical protein [Azospirillum argentinense]
MALIISILKAINEGYKLPNMDISNHRTHVFIYGADVARSRTVKRWIGVTACLIHPHDERPVAPERLTKKGATR